MKYLIMAAAVLALLSTPALARLGEDENTTSFRYGDPVKKEVVANFDKKLFYHDKPYNLEITYKDGRAVIIDYQLEGPAKRMSIWRIEHILHNNAKKEDGWKSIWYLSNDLGKAEEINFINEQGNATATYNLSTNVLTVRYMDIGMDHSGKR